MSGDSWARSFELPVILSQWPQGIEPYQKDATEQSLVVRLNTCGLDPAELKIHRSKKQRLIVLTGTHDDPAWNVGAPNALLRIDTGVPYADACVTLEGYPHRIIPASGLAQLVAYQALVAEVNEHMAE
jgi:hypothetical protein